MLIIHLGQDKIDCFAAWVSSKKAGLTLEDEPEHKINYGKVLLRSISENWHKVEIDPEQQKFLLPIPPHIPLIFR